MNAPPADVPPATLPRRNRDGHKGDYGRVLVVGGSRGMPGAPALAASAALRGGAGLVTMAVPEPVQLAAAAICPCATSIPLPVDADGRLAREALPAITAAANRSDVVAAGPGFSTGPDRAAVVAALLAADRPLVLDADGLNTLAGIDGWPDRRRCPLLLTPHPGEFSRLTGTAVAEIQADREQHARRAAAVWAAGSDRPLVLLLKGRGTVITDGAATYINPTGNPGMASGGSGDVLTGLAAALIVQCGDPATAARLAAWIHGRAGDLAAADLTEVSTTARDLLDYLPRAVAAVVA